MYQIFADYKNLIIFLHVISAVIWVGGMVAIRFATHQSLLHLEPKLRIERTLQILKRLFTIVSPFVVILLITAIILEIALGLKGDITAHIKELIWVIMSINLGVMIYRRNHAQRAFNSGDIAMSAKFLAPIAKYMVPANIALGTVAIYLGVVLRNSY